jgi:hypothetical protein
MTTWLGRLGLGLLVGGLWAGCAGSIGETGSDSQSIRMAQVEHLPGCDAEGGVAHGALTARPIADAPDLYAVFSNGAPLCIDSLEGAARNLGSFVVVEDAASSNPMPGNWQRANSNPMPGQGDPAASNPMPGQNENPADSNPMPGKDPVLSAYWRTH